MILYIYIKRYLKYINTNLLYSFTSSFDQLQAIFENKAQSSNLNKILETVHFYYTFL